ncbi:MAG: thermonuclease family protein [Pseudomonadota bacterium]
MARGRTGFWARLGRQAMRFAVLGLVIAASVVVLWLTQPPPFQGRASVADGDTIEVSGERIRLVGIDAPEFNQQCQADGRAWPCGREATRFLRRMISGREVICRPEGTDRFQRVLAECYLGDLSINRTLVAEGWALSFGEFRSEERQAEQDQKGLWRGTFQRPSGYRRDNPRVSNVPGLVWGSMRRWFGGSAMGDSL